MVFCNVLWAKRLTDNEGHNPYFNRWFSAISSDFDGKCGVKGHNPYFNRWFSAIGQ